MKIYITAKELVANTTCADCGETMSGDETVVIFQDETGAGLVPGLFCEDCAEYYAPGGSWVGCDN